jgi:PAS domain S-box-containing protein
MLDADGVIEHVNRTETDMLGYTREEMVGKPIFEFILPEQREDAEERFRLKLAGKSLPKQDDREYVKKDGSKVYVSIDDVVENDSDGKVSGVRSTMVDISEQKWAEEALRQSEARYRAIVEDQTELICRFLPDGTITFVNEAYCRFFGKKHRELIGLDFMQQIPEEDRPKVEKHLASLTHENPVATHEHRVIAPNGEICWQEWTNRKVFDERGELIVFQSVGRNITERKLMEEALKKSSEKVKVFAYSVSHDLKSPATGLYGLTKRFYKHQGDMLDEKAKNYCDQILRTAEQISALVEKINVYISTKETPLNIETIRLKEILQMVRDEFSAQLHVRDINWLQSENMPDIRGDRLSVLRVLRNLVDNALKYGGDDLSEITIGYEGSDEFHTIRVSNNGVGLETENSDKIFGLFQRDEASKGIEGSGLGLAIVKEVAEHHGGTVRVESSPEEGPTFYISISRHL